MSQISAISEALTPEAAAYRKIALREYRKAYNAKYREKNREKLNAYHNEWQRNHPDACKRYLIHYWENKTAAAIAAGEFNPEE